MPISRQHQQELTTECDRNPSLSLLQSISVTLSDIQMQLSTIEEQNLQRDSTLKELEKDIKDIKEGKQSSDTHLEVPKSKRCRKSPRGLSVSFSYIFDYYFMD